MRRAAATLLAAAVGLAGWGESPAEATTPASPEAWVRLAMERLCAAEPLSAFEAEAALPGAWTLEDAPETRGGAALRLRRRFALPGGGELRVEHLRPGGGLRRFTAAYFAIDAEGAAEPVLQGQTDGGCAPRAGRRLRREGEAHLFLDQLEGDLVTLRWTETLQAPWPPGRDPGGPRVAMIDSGLPYDLPAFRDRLARGPDGAPLGYDFWDLDPYPYDADVSRGPFLPIRHGGAVASILVREAPNAALIPYRYPRPDMSRMREVVARAAQAGARILAMPLGGRKAEDWRAFKDAMRANPQLLAIVSAGNDGRDIDAAPIFPAALDIPNMITVTSADGFGRLAEGANWGRERVDVMLPAENQPVIDFRGAQGSASGSSYAVPRLAALAARLLASQPELTTEALKAAIFAQAAPSPYDAGRVAVGWIPDPTADR